MTTAKKPAPRKTAARKAAPRKASPQPPADVDVDAEREAAAQQQLRDDAQRARENLVDFEAYRARARMRLGNTAEPQQIVPFVLGPAQGFDPPIVITMPEATRDQLAIDEYVEDGKPIKALRLMFNGRPDDFDRTLDAFDAQVKALRADGEHITTPELVIALWLRVLDHFTAQVGPGAADVPGGSNGS
jgi:hypothetical protein